MKVKQKIGERKEKRNISTENKGEKQRKKNI